MINYEKLKNLYSDSSILRMIRKQLNETPDRIAKKLGVSPELYKCVENEEIQTSSLPPMIQARIESMVNTYFGTFRLNRQMAFEMFVSSSGMNKKFFTDKFGISERSFYNYLAGDNINFSQQIDKFLLID
jgi:DNA-binding XRE family transcriptional regulator